MNKDLMERIYRDYHEKVRFLVMKKVGDPSEVEDMVSEIFLKIAKNLDKFDEEKASLSTWVYTVANRLIMDYYRTRRVFTELPQDNGENGELPEALVDRQALDADMLREEQLQELADALLKLKEKERDLIVLCYYKEMTLKQCAEVMGMSYANAKVLHKKALGKLNLLLSA